VSLTINLSVKIMLRIFIITFSSPNMHLAWCSWRNQVADKVMYVEQLMDQIKLSSSFKLNYHLERVWVGCETFLNYICVERFLAFVTKKKKKRFLALALLIRYELDLSSFGYCFLLWFSYFLVKFVAFCFNVFLLAINIVGLFLLVLNLLV
jgi:hypothetical protein